MIKHIECLVIDDDKDDQEIFMICVDRLGKAIRCTNCENGVDAISFLKLNLEYTPDFIFLDVNMPKMGGLDCLKELKKIDRIKESVIYMYSTTAEPLTLSEALKWGAKDFIVKPAKTGDLVKKLSGIF